MTPLPLTQLAVEHLGFEIDKKKSCRSWQVLKKNELKLRISVSNPNWAQDIYTEKWFSATHLLAWAGHPPVQSPKYFPSPPPPPQKKDQDNTLYVRDIVARRALQRSDNNYLTRRGINCPSLRFYGICANYESYTCPLYIYKERWRAQTYITYLMRDDGIRDRFFAKGLSRLGSISILKERGTPLQASAAAIFESPIDALSWSQLNKLPNDVLLLSTCGALTSALRRSLPSILTRMRVKKTLLAFDNDDAGELFADQLAHLLSPLNIQFERIRPKNKDWNDDLNP